MLVARRYLLYGQSWVRQVATLFVLLIRLVTRSLGLQAVLESHLNPIRP